MPIVLFLALPLAEIATFIMVGRQIGVLATLALVIASSTIGYVILRDAGLVALLKLERRQNPAAILAEAGRRGAAGLLLMVPGFLTDIAALALLIPGVGSGVARALTGVRRPGAGRTDGRPVTLDGDFRRLDQGP